MARSVGPGGRVLSFEPVDRSFSLLEKNVRANQWSERTVLHHVACSDVTGEIRGGMAAGMLVAGQIGDQPVRSVRIDDPDIDHVDFCKVDVEGFEPRVIQGMKQLLARQMPLLITEANQYWLTQAGSNTAAYCATLTGIGYRLFHIENDLREFEPAQPLDLLANTNLLAVPADRCREVLQSCKLHRQTPN